MNFANGLRQGATEVFGFMMVLWYPSRKCRISGSILHFLKKEYLLGSSFRLQLPT